MSYNIVNAVEAFNKPGANVKPNPFEDALNKLTVGGEVGIAFDAPAADVPAIKRHFLRYGQYHNVTVRSKFEPNADGKTVHVFATVIDRIKRTRKPKTDPDTDTAKTDPDTDTASKPKTDPDTDTAKTETDTDTPPAPTKTTKTAK